MTLKGKVALVTGASSGIGRATAIVLAERGADVACNGRDVARLEETVAAVRARGRLALALVADVADAGQVRAMVRTAQDCFGRIDILVNNAGHIVSGLVEQHSDSDWHRILDVHLGGAFYCVREVVPMMKRQMSGKIVNISSIYGMTGAPNYIAYSTAKAGLLGFTKALAKELAPFKINVNAVAPGSTMTAIQSVLDPAIIDARRQANPWKRYATPEDIAYAIAFLASDDADFITGQVISPNGGAVIVGI